MKRVSAEWVRKAEEDFTAAVHLSRKRQSPVPSIVCFHCQQCIEKYLKARLHESGIEFPKTHSLAALLKLAQPVEPLWESFRPALQALTLYAVEFRYPGEEAAAPEAKKALTICKTVRQEIRGSLGLGLPPQKQNGFQVKERRAAYRTRSRRK